MATSFGGRGTFGSSAPTARLAVVGGGPKAVALAAKASAIRAVGGPNIEVVVFDPGEIGSAWDGSQGFTDGNQRLCTLAERDIGFSYLDEFPSWGPRESIPQLMRQEYSWPAYLEAKAPTALGKWVNEGRLPPLHKEFAAYLRWAFANSNAIQHEHKVLRLEPTTSKEWLVHTDGRSRPFGPYSGVVLTGPGPARQVPGPASNRVFNGKDFWLRLKEVQVLIDAIRDEVTLADTEGIVIVGAGGTAAAILAWMAEHGAHNLPIKLVAKSQAAMHLRSENPFENRLVDDLGTWEALSPSTRRAFADRLNRGVVWGTVLERVSKATKLQVNEGKAERYDVEPTGLLKLQHSVYDRLGPPKLAGGPPEELTRVEPLAASMLVDASGFDVCAWTAMFDFLPSPSPREFREDLESSMGNRLQLVGPSWDDKAPVHAPNLSTMKGPGFSSLMCLGGMADRILAHYAP